MAMSSSYALPQSSVFPSVWRKIIKFISEPEFPYPLGFFRIGVSLLAIVQVVVLWPHLLQLYGNFGFIQWNVIETGTDIWVPSIGKLCVLLQPYGISSSTCVYGVFVSYFICLVGLFIGWKTRLFAVCAWLLHGLTVNSGYISLYGVDTMLHISLFYCAWMPVGGAFTIRHLLHRETVVPSFMARISQRTLQVHLCIIYFSTGLAKIRGIQWRNGEAIWRALMQPQFSVFDMSWLASIPLIPKLAAWSTLLLEIAYVVLIWPKRSRVIWLMGISLLHLSIGLLMGLWLFATIMIIMNITAFGFDLLYRHSSERVAPERKMVFSGCALGDNRRPSLS